MAAQTIRQEALTIVEAYLKRSGMAATRFGALVAGDPGFVRKLRSGNDFLVSTMENVLAHMAKNDKVMIAAEDRRTMRRA